jgi:hypothetical protein
MQLTFYTDKGVNAIYFEEQIEDQHIQNLRRKSGKYMSFR